MAGTTVTTRSRTARPAPVVAALYRALDGGIHHTRCNGRMHYCGPRPGRVELEFYCGSCHEHVTVPEFVATRLAIVTQADD